MNYSANGRAHLIKRYLDRKSEARACFYEIGTHTKLDTDQRNLVANLSGSGQCCLVQSKLILQQNVVI